MKNKSSHLNRVSAFDYFLYAFMGIFALILIYPFLYVIAGSLNDGADYLSGGVWILPRVFTWANYQAVFMDPRLYVGFRNTILRTVLGTAMTLSFTSLVAYAMSRPELKFRKVFYGLNMFAMFFSGGLIPFFLLIVKLGMYNTFFVYLLPMMYSVYNMIVFSSFFRSISEELRESAKIDGASEFQIFTMIYVPLSKAVFATIGLWVATSHWNSYMATMLYTKDDSLITLQYYLVRLVKESKVNIIDDPDISEKVNSTTISYAAIVIATVPVICIYPFLQKYFAKGIMIGSVKG